MNTPAPYRRVMAIVNATPDSFYAPSRSEGEGAVARRVAECVAEGADIVDIGGYSTRPGAEVVPVEEELRRVVAAVEEARRVAPQTTISIDTFRSEVAEAVLSGFRVSVCVVPTSFIQVISRRHRRGCRGLSSKIFFPYG